MCVTGKFVMSTFSNTGNVPKTATRGSNQVNSQRGEQDIISFKRVFQNRIEVKNLKKVASFAEKLL